MSKINKIGSDSETQKIFQLVQIHDQENIDEKRDQRNFFSSPLKMKKMQSLQKEGVEPHLKFEQLPISS